jgi:hypothetical protein
MYVIEETRYFVTQYPKASPKTAAKLPVRDTDALDVCTATALHHIITLYFTAHRLAYQIMV